MHLFTLIIGIWLLPRGDTLTCLECNPAITGNCTETQIECPSQGYRCGATREVTYAVGLKLQDVENKTCVLPEMCEQESVNFGAFRIVQITQCCNSDNCNSQPVPEPSNNTSNGKQCFSGSDLTCEGKKLPCSGNEDFCITITGGHATLKGCASKLMCSKLNYNASFYEGAHVSCCEGNLCNSGITTTASSVITTSVGSGNSTTPSSGITTSAGLQLVVVAMVSLALLS